MKRVAVVAGASPWQALGISFHFFDRHYWCAAESGLWSAALWWEQRIGISDQRTAVSLWPVDEETSGKGREKNKVIYSDLEYQDTKLRSFVDQGGCMSRTGSCEQCVHILAESALESSDLFAKRRSGISKRMRARIGLHYPYGLRQASYPNCAFGIFWSWHLAVLRQGWEIFLPAATLPPISMATSKPGNALAPWTFQHFSRSWKTYEHFD